jgi:YihY family inner membrane protein
VRERLLAMPVIGTALRVQERYVDDAADNFAASIAFFGFLSLFPLILLGISVLGFFLRGDADFEARVVEAVSDAVPGLGSALGDDGLAGVVDDVKRNAGSLLSVGTAVLLFTGLKVIAGAQRALAVVFRMDLIKGVAARAQQLLALLVLGSLALVGSAIGGSVGLDFGDGLRGVLISVGLTLLTFLVDLALFLVAYRFLSPSPGRPAWRVLLPGAVLAAIAWVALKAGAAALLTGGGNTDTYGQQLAAAVSLLAVLYLAGRVFMYGAELSGLRAELTTAPADDEVVGPLVEPRPLEDVGPKPAELARLAGFAAFLGVAGRLLDRR